MKFRRYKDMLFAFLMPGRGTSSSGRALPSIGTTKGSTSRPIGQKPPVISGSALVGSTLTITTQPSGYPGTGPTYHWENSTPLETWEEFSTSSTSAVVPPEAESQLVRLRCEFNNGGTPIDAVSNIIGPISAAFSPPSLVDGGTAFGSWAASSESNVGTSATPGWDENVIANWTVPTLDVIKSGETMNIGVIARHMNGIAKVQFSLNNGPWVDVLAETSNPNSLDSGRECTAYWVKINAADLTVDKRIEIRAKCIPQTAGIPRILQGDVETHYSLTGTGSQYQHSLVVYNAKNGYEHATDPVQVYCGDFGQGTPSDSNNGLTKATPVATLRYAYYRLGGSVGGESSAHDISGKTVWLGAGNFNHENYAYGTAMWSRKAFVHVRRDPAIDRENCVYNGDHRSFGSGLKMRYVALHGLKIMPRAGNTFNGQIEGIDTYLSDYGPCFNNDNQGVLWLDDCKFTSPFGVNTFNGTYNATDHPGASSANTNPNQCPTAEGWTSGWKSTIVTRPYVNYCHGTPCLGLCTMHVNIDFCAEDIVRNSMIAYDVVATNVRFLTTEHHPDVWQSYRAGGTIANQLCIKVVAVDGVGAQGFFCHGDTLLFRDIWIENWRVRNDNNGNDVIDFNDTLSCIQLQQPCRHVVLKDIRFQCGLAGFMLYRSGTAASDFTATNFFMRGVSLVNGNPITTTPVLADTAIFQTNGGSALGTWPGTLPWTEPTTGIVYQALS